MYIVYNTNTRLDFFLRSSTLPEWGYCFIKLLEVCPIPYRMAS